jgi:hypothetical protein
VPVVSSDLQAIALHRTVRGIYGCGQVIGWGAMADEIEGHEIEVDDPENVQWRWIADDWEFLASDGEWYLGEGPGPSARVEGHFRTCPDGHYVEWADTFCEQCGAQVRRAAHAAKTDEPMTDTALWRQTSEGHWQYRAIDGNWYFGDPNSPPPGTHVPPVFGAPGVSPPQVSDLQSGAWLSIIGGALMFVGSFLPWWHLTSEFDILNRNGFQLGTNESFSIDGAITVGLAVVAVLIGITRLTRSAMPRFFQRSPIIVAAGAAFSLYLSVQGIRDAQPSNGVTSTVGYGVWIIGIGIALVFFGGLVLRQHRDQPDRPWWWFGLGPF